MKLNSMPAIYGLIGYPVKHSLSPLMHNAAFRELGINAEYRLFEVKPEELENFLLGNIPIKDTEGKGFFSQKIMGFNITIPHKVRALELLSLLKNTAVVGNIPVLLSGAINTAERSGGNLFYYNTDIDGFVKSLQEDLKFDTRDKNVLILGCGGAGRAVIAALAAEGAGIKKIYVYDKSEETANNAQNHFNKFNLKEKLEFISLEQISEKIKFSDLLVNASPVGLKEEDNSIIASNSLHAGLSVYDLVYNHKTQLIKDAGRLGLVAVSGSGMLLYQGIAAFELWTKQKAPVEVMREALEKGLRQCRNR